MYTIKSITAVHNSYQLDHVEVIVDVQAKAWTKMRDKGELGSLYGIMISNDAYKIAPFRAYHPTVSDRERAKAGIKTIRLDYELTNTCKQKLGLNLNDSRTVLFKHGSKPTLRLVV